MKNLIIPILSLLFLLTTCSITTAQSTYSGASEKEFTSLESEPMNGYWQLTNTKSEMFNGAKNTQWTTGEVVTAISVWKDILNIEHTVSSSFKWEQPPAKLMPGLEVTLSGSYDNIEYSTPNKVYTGIKIFVDRGGVSFYNTTSDAVQVINVNKDNKLHTAEVQNGKFHAPKHFIGENGQIQIMIDCFIGKDHYVTTYTYEFVESSSL